MPKDYTRITKDENGGEVYHVPSGTPKEEMEKAKREGRVDKNDPGYTAEDAKKDAERNEEARKELSGAGVDGGKEADEVDDRNDAEETEDIRTRSYKKKG